MTEFVTVPMPAVAYHHIRESVIRFPVRPDWTIEDTVVTCSTPLPAFQCACGERRLRLVGPDGSAWWETELRVVQTPRCQVEYGGSRVVFLSGDGPPQVFGFGTTPEPDHWTDVSGHRTRRHVEAVMYALGHVAQGIGESATVPSRDNATEELLALVRTGDRPAFEALASCLMPPEDVAPCWDGARSRLGLAP